MIEASLCVMNLDILVKVKIVKHMEKVSCKIHEYVFNHCTISKVIQIVSYQFSFESFTIRITSIGPHNIKMKWTTYTAVVRDDADARLIQANGHCGDQTGDVLANVVEVAFFD